MLPEIALEALRYFDRTALEGLQIHSGYLRNVVNRHARTLPLRYIHQVRAALGNVRIQLTDDEHDEITVVAPGEQELNILSIASTMPSFIESRLTFACQIGDLRILGDEAEIVYTLVDFLGAHLKPQTYGTWMRGLRENYIMLFKHDALRRNVRHLAYEFDWSPAADCIIPLLFGVGAVETCAIRTYGDPRPWISKFIEMFETDERGTDIVRSVTLLVLNCLEESPRNAARPLTKPQLTDASTPRTALLEEWSREAGANGNASLAKKLSIFAWTAELLHEEEPVDLYYAFLLQVVDV